MGKIKISVVIPNYNGSKTIERCIRSILSHEKNFLEIIVIDDSSTDNSAEIVKNKFPNIKVITNSKNFGASFSRNQGILNSKGDYLLILDNDVFLTENCIEKMKRYINKYDIIYPKVIYENGRILSPALNVEKKYIRRSPVFLVRKDALSKLDELFDENYFVYYEDVDFFFRCFLTGLRSKFVSSALAYHAILPNRNLEKRFYLETRNKLYFFIKFSGIPKEIRELFKIPTIRDFFGMFFVALSNKNIFAECKIQEKISNSRIKLIYLFLKAIFWNLTHLKVSLRKRKKMNLVYRNKSLNVKI